MPGSFHIEIYIHEPLLYFFNSSINQSNFHSAMAVIEKSAKYHHHHHLSRSCHCWQMASTTHAMHFDVEPLSSISFWEISITRFSSLGVYSDVILAHLVLLILATYSAHCPLMYRTLSITLFTPVSYLIISFRNLVSLRDV